MTTLLDLQEAIEECERTLDDLRKEKQGILKSAEYNTFETREEADLVIEGILESRASEDCEGSYNCGEKEYTQEFIVGDHLYQATMTFEYNRYDKQFYCIEESEYKSEAVAKS